MVRSKALSALFLGGVLVVGSIATAVQAEMVAPRATTSTAEQDEVAALASSLTEQLAAQCPNGAEDAMLAIISDETSGLELDLISAALDQIVQSLTLCASARAAVASASQAAQLALAARDATGATVPGAPAGAPPSFPFSSSGGSPGGSGGPGYVS